MDKDTFLAVLSGWLLEAQAAGRSHFEVTAKGLHRAVGGYPGRNHRMPACCRAMRSLMREGDGIVAEPPSGEGATLHIRYRLPR